jgi:aspartate/methionine/tyrosine aminotransferase
MTIEPFALERYFAKHEFSSRYLLSSSDCESLSLSDLVGMADTETRRLWEGLKLGYTESYGHPLLREEIASIYSGIEMEDTLVAAPEEIIYLLMHALLQAGDHVICTFPGYQSLYEVAQSIGCRVSRWEPDEQQGWCFDIEWLRREIRADTKLLVVNFPHNPTGYLPTVDEYMAIIELARERGIYLLSDEMYRFLEIEEGTTLPSACERYRRAFSLFGLSKSFGLPGLRIGWIATRQEHIREKMAGLKDYTTICSSAPSEILAIIALRNRGRITGEQLQRVRDNVAALDSFFDEYKGLFNWNRPLGGSICFPRMLAVEDTFSFCEQLVQESGIMLAPSRIFNYGDQHVRIGFGREDLPQVLERFRGYLEGRF